MKNKPLLWGAGIVAVVLIAYFAFFSSSTDTADLQGAIGVAKQHRTDQITDADVVLQDPEIQDLLQSEFFYKLTTDDAFRKVAVDQLARMNLSSGRSMEFTSVASLVDMKSFLDLVAGNQKLAQAMAEGRMSVVREALDTQGRSELMDVANRVWTTLGRHPQINLTVLGNMRTFVESALGNAQLRSAITAGKLDMVNEALASSKQADLSDAAQKVFIAEARRPNLDCAGQADLKVFLDLAVSNTELRAALLANQMDQVRAILDASNRLELLDAANRVHLGAARSGQLDAAALGDMKVLLDQALSNRDLKVSLLDGDANRVNQILVKDGRTNLDLAAQRVMATDRRQPQFAEAGLGDLKVFLDLAVSNADLKAAMADGRMSMVNTSLLESGKAELIDAANRVYSLQGLIQINESALGDMRVFLNLALDNQNLKQALVEGRIAKVNEALVQDGKTSMCAAANRVCFVENRHPQLSSAAELSSMRAITNLAGENAEFRQAIEAGRVDEAGRMAINTGHYDISLRTLQMASYVVGDRRNFVPDLNRIVAVADSPAFRSAAENPGFGRLVASADAASWKQTVDAVKDGKMAVNN